MGAHSFTLEGGGGTNSHDIEGIIQCSGFLVPFCRSRVLALVRLLVCNSEAWVSLLHVFQRVLLQRVSEALNVSNARDTLCRGPNAVTQANRTHRWGRPGLYYTVVHQQTCVGAEECKHAFLVSDCLVVRPLWRFLDWLFQATCALHQTINSHSWLCC